MLLSIKDKLGCAQESCEGSAQWRGSGGGAVRSSNAEAHILASGQRRGSVNRQQVVEGKERTFVNGRVGCGLPGIENLM